MKAMVKIKPQEMRYDKKFITFLFIAYALLDAAGRYDIKDLKVHTGRCKCLILIIFIYLFIYI